MRESTIVDKIRLALRERGAWVYKTHGGAGTMSGVPDLVGVLDGRFFGFEVKQPGQHATPLQRYSLDEIAKAGGLVGVVHSVREMEDLLCAASGLSTSSK